MQIYDNAQKKVVPQFISFIVMGLLLYLIYQQQYSLKVDQVFAKKYTVYGDKGDQKFTISEAPFYVDTKLIRRMNIMYVLFMICFLFNTIVYNIDVKDEPIRTRLREKYE
jgi:hypothetical protein